MNTMIILLLGLIVFVVLIVIFTGKTQWFSKSSGNCEFQPSGECVDKADGGCATSRLPYTCDEGKNGPRVCCSKV